MTVARVGSVASGTSTIAYPQTPTAGNLLVLTLIGAASSIPTSSTTGWVLVDSVVATWFGGGGWNIGMAVYIKVAVGGDAAPTATSATGWLLEELSGLSVDSPKDTTKTGHTNNDDGITTLSATLAAVPVTEAVYSVQAVGYSSAPTLGWSAGVTADATTITLGATTKYAATGIAQAPGSTSSITCTATSSPQPNVWVLITVALRLFGVAPPAPAPAVISSGRQAALRASTR